MKSQYLSAGIKSFALMLLLGAAPPSGWKLETKSDPITDAKSVNLTLAQDPNLLFVSCDKADPRLFSITVGTTTSYLGGNPVLRPTIVRFDSRPPETQSWGYTGRFAVSQGREREFIVGIETSKKVAIRLLDRREAPTDVIFSLTGSSAQIARFRSACAAIGIK